MKKLEKETYIFAWICIAIVAIVVFLAGCNMQVIDTTWTFKYADIENVGTVEVQSWCDYENSDMIQVTAKDGTTYLTHSCNVILRTK